MINWRVLCIKGASCVHLLLVVPKNPDIFVVLLRPLVYYVHINKKFNKLKSSVCIHSGTHTCATERCLLSSVQI